jgi:hypothetical protein
MNNNSINPRRKRNLLIFFALLAVVVLIASFSLSYIFLTRPSSPPTGSITPTTTTTGPATCNGQGVTKNADGSYTFSWLHVNSQGQVVDAHNCLVHLLGMNMGGLFLSSAGHQPPASISWYKQNVPMNVVREAINTYWWDTNVYVPNAHMHFQQWLETVINWQKQNGNYVIIDAATEFHNPPCGTGVTVPCPSQDQANKNNPPNPEEQSTYQPTPLQALTDLAKMYGNDPQIIFDVWNEPSPKEISGISMQTYFQDMNQRINAVRQYAPNSIVMVYENGLQQIMSGQYPMYTQKNLMFDTHIYDASWKPGDTTGLVSFVHAHGDAFIVGEWGGVPGQPSPSVMIPFLKQYDVEACYFGSKDLVKGSAAKSAQLQLNSIGQAVASGYGSIFGS